MQIDCIKISKTRRPINEAKVGDLKHSIETIGLLHPILISKDLELISGHHRLLALKGTGLKTLKKEHYRVTDFDALKKELAELDENLMRSSLHWSEEAIALKRRKEIYESLFPRTKHGGDRGNQHSGGRQVDDVSFCQNTAQSMGISERSVQRKIQMADIIDQHEELKACKTAREAKFRYERLAHEAKRKEVVEKEEHRDDVIHGDCLEEIGQLKDGSVACLLSDPPYGIGLRVRKGRSETGKIVNDDEKAFPLLDQTLAAMKPKLKPDASVYIFCSWKVVAKFMAITEKHFSIKNLLVWVKHCHGHSHDGKGWLERHELCIYAVNGDHRTVGTRPANVLEYVRTNDHHPCEKPVDLLKFIIEKSTVPGELVVDPFAGSGSTGVAAQELGRKFTLFEIEAENIEVIKARLASQDSKNVA